MFSSAICCPGKVKRMTEKGSCLSPAPEQNMSFLRMKNPIPTQWVLINPGELCLVFLTLSHGAGQGPSQTKILSRGVERVYLCLA